MEITYLLLKSIFRASTKPYKCECSGLINTQAGKSINVKFDLGFVGDVSDQEILAIIRERAKKIFKDGFELVFIDDFLVNVQSAKQPTTTPTTDLGIIGRFAKVPKEVVMNE